MWICCQELLPGGSQLLAAPLSWYLCILILGDEVHIHFNLSSSKQTQPLSTDDSCKHIFLTEYMLPSYHHMTENSNKIFSFWFQRIHKNKTLTHINVYWAFGGVQKRSAVEISCYSGPVYAALSCYGTANIVSDTHCKHPITHIESNGTSQYQNIALPGYEIEL